jgi:hypothetical protein
MDWLWEIIDSGSERKICLAFIYFSRYNCYIPFMRFDLIMLTSLDSWLAFNDISNNGRPVIDGAFLFILNLVSKLLSWMHTNSEYGGEKSIIYIRFLTFRGLRTWAAIFFSSLKKISVVKFDRKKISLLKDSEKYR